MTLNTAGFFYFRMLKGELSKSYLSECNLIKYGKIEADDVSSLIEQSRSSAGLLRSIYHLVFKTVKVANGALCRNVLIILCHFSREQNCVETSEVLFTKVEKKLKA